MDNIKDDGRGHEHPTAIDPIGPAPEDPPFAVLFPNLERVSRAGFRKGTISRQRINRSLMLAAVFGVVVVALIAATILL